MASMWPTVKANWSSLGKRYPLEPSKGRLLQAVHAWTKRGSLGSGVGRMLWFAEFANTTAWLSHILRGRAHLWTYDRTRESYRFPLSNLFGIIGLSFIEIKIWPKWGSMYCFRRRIMTFSLQIEIKLMICGWKFYLKAIQPWNIHWLINNLWMEWTQFWLYQDYPRLNEHNFRVSSWIRLKRMLNIMAIRKWFVCQISGCEPPCFRFGPLNKSVKFNHKILLEE